ncbi:hypothetical protein ACE15N_00175 [Xanthomonas campestris pv. passiflorae]|uniref:hypothetical protein n=1 Tax=Xanthomonas campestris TaxID=339 RepID=UPI0024235C24|nr:hypothetical protein [Xanthomonas campestris]MBV6816186.1 hypothetical protein [Xanthomonas campestris pv. passiflorae]
MKSSATNLDKASKRVAWCCALLTAVFTATTIDWRVVARTDQWLVMLILFGVTASLGAAPYAIYSFFVPASKAGPVLKLFVLCTLCALSLVPNAWWIEKNVRTDGWNFFIVPVLQILYLLVIVPFIIILTHALSRELARKR